ncbi:TetR/AcrR family transcriptional regulator [Micromonosporaceae bacterium Da 78-11]
MTVGTGQRPRGAGRAQLHETALRLFARDGVDGTSLQAIADEMGVSKAAVYYHYRTKDELILGVLAPIMAEVTAMAERVGAQRGRQARLDAMVTGIAALAVDSHDRFAVVMGDPYVGQLVADQAIAQGWISLIELVTGPETDDAARVALAIFIAGLLGPLRDPSLVALGPDALREHMAECGRRLLQIRRRPSPSGKSPAGRSRAATS